MSFTFGGPVVRTRSRSEAVEEIQPESQESLTGALSGVSLADAGRQSSSISVRSSSGSSKSSGKI